MNAFAIQATVMNRCSCASFLHSPIGSGNEDDCKSSAKSRDECSGSFPDKMIEETGCSIFWTGKAEWIRVFEFF